MNFNKMKKDNHKFEEKIDLFELISIYRPIYFRLEC